MGSPFKFDGALANVPVPEDLSNGERALLRSMMEPGNPLWKIFRSILDYREGLKQGLLKADFSDPMSIEAARKVQATALAIHWLEETFEAALTDVVEHQPNEEPAR